MLKMHIALTIGLITLSAPIAVAKADSPTKPEEKKDEIKEQLDVIKKKNDALDVAVENITKAKKDNGTEDLTEPIRGILEAIEKIKFASVENAIPAAYKLKKEDVFKLNLCTALLKARNELEVEIVKLEGMIARSTTSVGTAQTEVTSARDKLGTSLFAKELGVANKPGSTISALTAFCKEATEAFTDEKVFGKELATDPVAAELIEKLNKGLPDLKAGFAKVATAQKLGKDMAADDVTAFLLLPVTEGKKSALEDYNARIKALGTRRDAVIKALPGWLKGTIDTINARTVLVMRRANDVRRRKAASNAFAIVEGEGAKKFIADLEKLELAAESARGATGIDASASSEILTAIRAVADARKELSDNMALMSGLLQTGAEESELITQEVRLSYFPEVSRLVQMLNPTAKLVDPTKGVADGVAVAKFTELRQREASIREVRANIEDIKTRLQRIDFQVQAARAAKVRTADILSRALGQQQGMVDARTKLEKQLSTTDATDEKRKQQLQTQIDGIKEKEEVQAKAVEAATADKTSAETTYNTLFEEQNGMPAKRREAETLLKTEEDALSTLRKDYPLLAQQESDAFANARDNAPYFAADPIPDDPDPVRRVYLFADSSSRVLYIRGQRDDVAVARETIAEFDKPAPQTKLTFYTLQLSGTDEAFGLGKKSKAKDILGRVRKDDGPDKVAVFDTIEENLDAIRSGTELVVDALRQAVSTVVFEKAKESKVNNPRLARYNFYSPHVLYALGFPMGKVELDDSTTAVSRYALPDPARLTTLGEIIFVLSLSDEPVRTQVREKFNARIIEELERTQGVGDPEDTKKPDPQGDADSSDAGTAGTTRAAAIPSSPSKVAPLKVKRKAFVIELLAAVLRTTAQNSVTRPDEITTAAQKAVEAAKTVQEAATKAVETATATDQAAKTKTVQETAEAAKKAVEATNKTVDAVKAKADTDKAAKTKVDDAAQAARKAVDAANEAVKTKTEKAIQAAQEAAKKALEAAEAAQAATAPKPDAATQPDAKGTPDSNSKVRRLLGKVLELQQKGSGVEKKVRDLSNIGHNLDNAWRRRDVDAAMESLITILGLPPTTPPINLPATPQPVLNLPDNTRTAGRGVSTPSNQVPPPPPDIREMNNHEFSPAQKEILDALIAKARTDVAGTIYNLTRQLDAMPEELRYSSRLARDLRKQYVPLVGWLANGGKSITGDSWTDLGSDTLGFVRGEEMLQADPGDLPDLKEPTKPESKDPVKSDAKPSIKTANRLRDGDRIAFEVARLQYVNNPLSKATGRIEAADLMIRGMIDAFDDDLKRLIRLPALQDIRHQIATNLKGVSFGGIEETSFLATNRRVARVDPVSSAGLTVDEKAQMAESAAALSQLVLKQKEREGVRDSLLGAGLNGIAADSIDKNAGTPVGILSLLSSLMGTPSADPQSAATQTYSISSGNLYKITPIFGPSGQGMRFNFDFAGTTRLQEPKGGTNPLVPRIDRHTINTEVGLSNLEMRQITSFDTNYQLGMPKQRTGGMPLLNMVPGLKDIPIVGYFSERGGQAPIRQKSIILAQSVLYPTVGDVVGLMLDSAVSPVTFSPETPSQSRLPSEVSPFTIEGFDRIPNGNYRPNQTFALRITLSRPVRTDSILTLEVADSDELEILGNSSIRLARGEHSAVFRVKRRGFKTSDIKRIGRQKLSTYIANLTLDKIAIELLQNDLNTALTGVGEAKENAQESLVAILNNADYAPTSGGLGLTSSQTMIARLEGRRRDAYSFAYAIEQSYEGLIVPKDDIALELPSPLKSDEISVQASLLKKNIKTPVSITVASPFLELVNSPKDLTAQNPESIMTLRVKPDAKPGPHELTVVFKTSYGTTTRSIIVTIPVIPYVIRKDDFTWELKNNKGDTVANEKSTSISLDPTAFYTLYVKFSQDRTEEFEATVVTINTESHKQGGAHVTDTLTRTKGAMLNLGKLTAAADSGISITFQVKVKGSATGDTISISLPVVMPSVP